MVVKNFLNFNIARLGTDHKKNPCHTDLANLTKYSGSGHFHFLERLLEEFARKGDGLTSLASLFLGFLLEVPAFLLATAPWPFRLVRLLLLVVITRPSSSVISSSSVSESLSFGLPGGLSARIALFPTFLIGRKIQSRSPPNDFRNENKSFSPFPIRSFILSPKFSILIR